jgi:dihydroorotase
MQQWLEKTQGGNFRIAGARIVDPVAGREFDGALDVAAGKIVAVHEGEPPAAAAGVSVLDAGGLCLAPGLIDMHVHFREPGQEDKETVETGSRAAARGGVTAVACMPNTDPICDNASVVRLIREQAARAGFCNVWPVGAITSGSKSEQLADIGEMLDVGAIAFSDDGRPVETSGLLRHAMELALSRDALLISHAEDLSLAKGGCMHEGAVSTRLGLKGIPREAEDIATDRDVRLAGMTGARLHIAHVASGASVEIIRRAKAAGIRVTAETAPHYLLLDHSALEGYDSHKKMNPPLRESSDQAALIEGLVDGTLDCVATDHAPHTEIEKEQELAYAPFGVIGLETLLPALITRLVGGGLMSLPAAVALVTSRPAAILGLEAGRLEPGLPADLCLFDPDEVWQAHGVEMASKSNNTPFEGMKLSGRVRGTFLGGYPVFMRTGIEDGASESWIPRPWRAGAALA